MLSVRRGAHATCRSSLQTKNGARVYSSERSMPMRSERRLSAGAAFEPDKAGTASMTNRMLRLGAEA